MERRAPTLKKPLPWQGEGSPFHVGEQAVQARVGVRERIEQTGRRLLRDFMPDEHREFFEDLPFVIAGSADREGSLWASLVLGEPGFVSASSPKSLVVRGSMLPGDPVADNIAPGAALGLLGIELLTRRRNRVNGQVARAANGGFELRVQQSFGNCKQYIQSRALVFASPASLPSPSPEAQLLSAEASEILARADTAFIATSSRDARAGGVEGLDVSHRGGRPGFIRSERAGGASLVTLPDFSGNFMFNSFGNLEVNPHAGLLALDFDSGAVLSLTGEAAVIWDGPEVEAFAGAERLLQFRVRSGWLWRGVLLQSSEPEFSAHLRGTGTWGEAGQRR